ncbi:o-methyltransferase, partial [Colletotrichum musicola]
MSPPHTQSQGGRRSQASLRNKLVTLEASLQAFDELLSDPETDVLLSQSLHSDTALPDSELLRTSQRIVDFLSLIEHRLEPASLRLADYFLGYTTTKCLVTAVQLNVADHLASGPLSLDDLADIAQADPQKLGQILRPLYTSNIFNYDEQTGLYRNNRVSELIRADHWTQWRNWVELYGNQFYDIAAGIPQAVGADRGTRSAAQHVFNTDDDMFTYFQSRGWVPQLHRTLGAGAAAMAPGILADYPWHELAGTTVMDIGGGGGALIASLLRAHPTMQGGIFDLPSVIDHVRPMLGPGGQLEDVGLRLTRLVGGDFLKE